jgi:hypothetical protein
MANITLKIDDDLLKKARQLASQKNTSINAIFNKTIQDFVRRNLNRDATLRSLDSFYKKCKAIVGKKSWTRDELHER